MSGTVLDTAGQLRNKSHFLSSRGLLTRRKERHTYRNIYTSTRHCIREELLEKMMPNGDLMDEKGFILETQEIAWCVIHISEWGW